MNPILLKPTNDTGSQVIVNGVPIGNMDASAYYQYKRQLVRPILDAYHSLEKENDIIVLEGAGSPAEINLKHCQHGDGKTGACPRPFGRGY